jgi:hypothetical protein
VHLALAASSGIVAPFTLSAEPDVRYPSPAAPLPTEAELQCIQGTLRKHLTEFLQRVQPGPAVSWNLSLTVSSD